ncbi:efflux RND transporter periplasmic adaptor subunit [Ereboglobus luteus]|uniref:CzcB-like C-terminal circularly permuted SH3-like domain-containing protein n=1 Tax=Ereboglobus luteus TaxID=1796921 RepID=A0A2U8E431_9BACT|nr:efflux RND transporter periplasmic adaptor subunit [Ereboglobus luteus]AWI09560.1 hypothetical protein CKA38_10185 [Ereboglobus luteus]
MKTSTNHASARSGGVPPPDATKSRPILFAITLIAALAFATSCSRHDDHAGHDHAGHDHNKQQHDNHDHADQNRAARDHDAHDGHDHAAHSAPEKTDPHADHDHAKPDRDHSAPGHDHKTEPAQKRDPHAGHSHGASESTNVTYDEKNGLKFDDATAHAINLATTRIVTRPFAHRVMLNATVVDAGPPVQVTALVPPSVADDMQDHPHEGVRILAINRALTHATGQVEVTLALADIHNMAQTAKSVSSPGTDIGDSLAIPLIGPPEQKLTIPNTAVLRTIEGTFAYLYHDGHYRRTPVVLGMTDGAHTEIISGLAPDAPVAATAVEQLWLTELRLTKGGGHSH